MTSASTDDMSARPQAIVSWSSGKDSAFALDEVRRSGEVHVVGLLTTVTSAFARVSMHGVREELLDLQADALELPCSKILIPSPCSNDLYERELAHVLAGQRSAGVTHVVFGDLFLEDLRQHREAQLTAIGMKAVFPLWKRDTMTLARKMIDDGLKTVITCIDPRKLDPRFAGRAFDHAFLDELPASVDPCGENGEFHTFAWSGPMFSRPIAVKPGAVVERGGFAFADLLPA